MNRTTHINWLIVVFALLCYSCGKGKKEYHSIIDRIESHSVTVSKDSSLLDGKFNPEELIRVGEGDHSFLVKSRKASIQSYACSECHSGPVESLRSNSLGKKAHWNISLIHAEEKTMDCATCHSDSNMDNLVSITGKNIDFDQSHLLCKQCHNKQGAEWSGGAHGKNLGGWKGPRVSRQCVECHNPHEPSIRSKWPSRYNTQMANQRTQ